MPRGAPGGAPRRSGASGCGVNGHRRVTGYTAKSLVAKGGIEPPTQGFSALQVSPSRLSNRALATHAMFLEQRHEAQQSGTKADESYERATLKETSAERAEKGGAYGQVARHLVGQKANRVMAFVPDMPSITYEKVPLALSENCSVPEPTCVMETWVGSNVPPKYGPAVL